MQIVLVSNNTNILDLLIMIWPSRECIFCQRKPILQIIRKILCSRTYFPFFRISLCVVLLSSFRLHSQAIRVILREIKILKGAQGNKGAKSKAKSEEKEKCSFFFLIAFRFTFRSLASLCSFQKFLSHG